MVLKEGSLLGHGEMKQIGKDSILSKGSAIVRVVKVIYALW